MIHSIRIQNFKSLRDVTLRLQDVNLLIGPNNSGKSNVLKALAFLGRYLNGHYPDNEELKRLSFQHKIEEKRFSVQFTVCYKDDETDIFYYYNLKLYYKSNKEKEGKYEEFFGISNRLIQLSEVNEDNSNFIFYRVFSMDDYDIRCYDKNNGLMSNIESGMMFRTRLSKKQIEVLSHFITVEKVFQGLKNSKLYNIKLSSFTGITTQQVVELKGDASNLMSYLDYLNNNHPFKLMKIAEELNKCVSDFKLVRTPQIDLEKKDNVRQVKLFDKNDIGFWADEVSEGTLYFLALLCIIFQPKPPNILMLEEPEKGIHPRRIHEVMEYIFELAEEQGVQIILTSHSPQVVDKFKDWEESIFVVDKPENETIIKNLQTDIIDDSHRRSEEKNTPKVNYRRALGDHWVTGLLGGVPA